MISVTQFQIYTYILLCLSLVVKVFSAGAVCIINVLNNETDVDLKVVSHTRNHSWGSLVVTPVAKRQEFRALAYNGKMVESEGIQ